MNPKQLQALHLYKTIDQRAIVNDVSFTVDQGSIVGLLGPNGAGKTSAFYLVAGLVKSDQGHIYLNGNDITHQTLHERAKLGLNYLPQEPSIFRRLSVQDNILAILELQPELTPMDRKARVNELLEEFRIAHLASTLGHQLSGGERRRVEIARALAANPRYLLLDEPFAGIDPISITDIQNMIIKLSKRDIGILITDHNVRETLKLCHHAYILNHGKIICSGDANAILNNKEVRQVYLGEEFDI